MATRAATSEARPPWSTAFPRLTALAFGLAAATAASLQPARAARCTVPDAILHDRCISKLSVTVRAGRSCAISFTVLCSGRPRAAPPDADRPAVPPGSCFVFNGQRVCE